MTDEEIVVAVHSDVWANSDGTATWEMDALDGSGRRETGASASIEQAYTDMRGVVERWYDTPVSSETRVIRPHFDAPG